MTNDDLKKELESRVLGHILSKEEMELVAGGDGDDGITTLPPVSTTVEKDGLGDEEGPGGRP